MKNLLKHLTAWTVLFSIIWFFSGCSTAPEVIATPVKSIKQDLIAKAVTNKEKSRLQSILSEIMNEGSIETRHINAERYADGTEISTEEWVIKDKLGNMFIVKWENSVLISIDDIEKVKTDKPLGE